MKNKLIELLRESSFNAADYCSKTDCEECNENYENGGGSMIILAMIPGFFMARAYVQNDLPGIVFYGFCYLACFLLSAILSKIRNKKD